LLILGVGLGGRYEAEFRAGLEQGFQQRVELGDLASSVLQLKRSLEVPRVLDSAYVKAVAERSKELESKAKAQSDAGRYSDLSLPSKELDQIRRMEAAFEQLATSVALIERGQALKLALRASDAGEFPAIRKVTALFDSYVEAVSALRNSNNTVAALQKLSASSIGLGENIGQAVTESRRKGAPLAWKELLAAIGAEKADLSDRFFADARLIDDFQSFRARSISKLDQLSARVDGAERMLLQSRATGGLLVVASLLTWGGVALGLTGMFLAIGVKRRQIREENMRSDPVGTGSVPADGASSGNEHIEPTEMLKSGLNEPPLIGSKPSEAIAYPMNGTPENPRPPQTYLTGSNQDSPLAASVNTEPIASGYWISAGSMVERRVALLDRQSEQLERHVKLVLAAAESLAGRADLVLQSLQLLTEAQPNMEAIHPSFLEQRLQELQALSMNLALKAPDFDLNEPLMDQLEQFNDKLVDLTEQIAALGGPHPLEQALSRRVQTSIDEGRRLSAAADSLRERTETLYEDAQRFRRHSEALIRGIQEGAISDVPASALRASLISN